MNPEHRTSLKRYSVVQLSPNLDQKAFASCFMIVDKVHPSWGAIGYVQAIGENGMTAGGQSFYRAKWSDMAYIGEASWVLDFGGGIRAVESDAPRGEAP